MNMNKYIITSFVLVSLAAVVSLTAQDVANRNNHQGPPILGPHWAKGIHPARSGGSPDMTFQWDSVDHDNHSNDLLGYQLGHQRWR
jgi:hypothetical protein